MYLLDIDHAEGNCADLWVLVVHQFGWKTIVAIEEGYLMFGLDDRVESQR